MLFRSSSGPTCISTGSSRDDANVNGCCLSTGRGFLSTGGSVRVSSTAGDNLRSIKMRSGSGRIGGAIHLLGAVEVLNMLRKFRKKELMLHFVKLM